MWPEAMKIMRPHVAVSVARIHTKIITAEMLDGARYVFEGSANLRSSDTVENLCIVNDPATHDAKVFPLEDSPLRLRGFRQSPKT